MPHESLLPVPTTRSTVGVPAGKAGLGGHNGECCDEQTWRVAGPWRCDYSWGLSGAPGRPFGYSSRKRSATAGVTSSPTFPPNDAISFTPLDETKA